MRFAAALLLLFGCDALSGVVELGVDRPPSSGLDASASEDASTRPDAAELDASIDAGPPDATPRKSDLAISFLSDPPQAIEPGGSFDVEVTVENRGSRASSETSLRFELAAAGALLLSESLLGSIASGASESRRVRAMVPTSTVGAHRLRAAVDPQGVVDELDESNNVALAGRVFIGALVVLPQSLDLSTPAGCVREARLAIENKSARSAVVTALVVEGAAEFSATSPAPIELAPGAVVTATVGYAPLDGGADRAVLRVEHDLGGAAIPIELTGDGDDRPRTDVFQQFAARRVDLLFIVDNSCSMAEEQANLGARFAAFLDFASDEIIDYHVAVTTTDLDPGGAAGRFVGTPPVIHRATLNAGGAFAANAMVGLDGAQLEQGLLAAELALSPPLIDAENAGFLRPEASLAIVYVSDEDDQSPGDTDARAAFLTALRPPPFLRVNAIAGDVPDGCATASPGVRYRAMVDAIGGVTASICDEDWDQTLIALAAGGFGFQTRFVLSGAPVVGTVEVRVGGVVLGAEFWEYEAEGNAIVFEPAAIPEAGVVIEVSYLPGCAE